MWLVFKWRSDDVIVEVTLFIVARLCSFSRVVNFLPVLPLAWHAVGVLDLLSRSKINHLTRKMASAQVVETSVANNSPSQDFSHPDDHFQSRYICSCI